MKKYIKKLQHRIGRAYSSLHCYDYKPTNNGWKKYDNFVFPKANDNGVYFDPFVRKWADEYRMYVSDRNRSNIICLCSGDGISWIKKADALIKNSQETWDEVVNRACVLQLNDRWMMWYTGQHDSESAIGIAVSEDGFKFHRIMDTPVLKPEYDFEKKSVMNPCVLWDKTSQQFKMWYVAGEQYEPDVLCYATSNDGIKWQKSAYNPVLSPGINDYDNFKVGACDIMATTTGYYMFYIGYQTIDIARICVAYSENGINNWKRINSNPILSPEKNKWDAHAVYKPTICYDEKNQIIHLWYNGRNKYEEKIGYAYKKLRGDLL